MSLLSYARRMSAPAFYTELRALRLERVLDASVELITEEGWDRLSITKVAQRSGVPRQSLHKEVGTKAELGRAVVDREVERFLARVQEGVAAHPDSLEDGIAAAARHALDHGRENAVLAAVLRPGHDHGLLELVAVHPDVVLGNAVQALGAQLGAAAPEAMVDTVVRLVLSHLLQPTVEVDQAVDRIRHVVRGFA